MNSRPIVLKIGGLECSSRGAHRPFECHIWGCFHIRHVHILDTKAYVCFSSIDLTPEIVIGSKK